jgi:DNA-binding FadR family transcriptional regulator
VDVAEKIAPKRKLAELVARRIEDDIVRRGWPVGENLGAEATLVARYEVSRAVLREAISILEYKQVAAARRGRGGGLVVQAPAAAVVAEAVSAYFHFADVSVDELYEARTVLQVLAARLAAERMSEEDIVTLRTMTEDRIPRGGVLDVTLARLSRNPVLTIFVPTLTRLTGALAGAPSTARLTGAESEARKRAWTAIVEAMIAGDEGALTRRMTRQLQAERAWLARVRRDPANVRPEQSDVNSGKLAERVALAIRQEIHDMGWPIGDVLGNEPALLDRYGISRPVFREAVRILEHHGVARMRQGPGGGLVITAPDPGRVVDALALYLEYLKVGVADMFEVRTALEVRCAELAASRTGPSAEKLLRDAIEVERAAATQGPDAHADLHVVLAEAAGNRLIAMFIAAFARLTVFRSSSGAYEDPAALGRAALAAHEKIIASVLRGDTSLARHRMLRHLQGLAPWLAGTHEVRGPSTPASR